MGVLSDLPDTDGKERQAITVTSVTHAVNTLRVGLAIIAAADNGCITVWRGDSGLYQCDFQRFMVSLDRKEFKYIAAVREWLREWWPKMFS